MTEMYVFRVRFEETIDVIAENECRARVRAWNYLKKSLYPSSADVKRIRKVKIRNNWDTK